MVSIGLTGGIGSGKSTVAHLLAERGAHVIDADKVSKDLLSPGSTLLLEVEKIFAQPGQSLLYSDGSINRAKVADIIFSDPEARNQLNNLLHPRIHEIHQSLEAEILQQNPHAVVVHDIPILVENGIEAEFTGVLVVEAPLEVRAQRILERGMSEEQIIARIASQASDEERRAAAIWIVHNDKDIASLEMQIDHLWPAIQIGLPFLPDTPWWNGH